MDSLSNTPATAPADKNGIENDAVEAKREIVRRSVSTFRENFAKKGGVRSDVYLDPSLLKTCELVLQTDLTEDVSRRAGNGAAARILAETGARLWPYIEGFADVDGNGHNSARDNLFADLDVLLQLQPVIRSLVDDGRFEDEASACAWIKESISVLAQAVPQQRKIA